LSCYLPEAGAGEYELAALLAEAKIKNPQYFTFLEKAPTDPLTGSDTLSRYTYKVGADGQKCLLYANLENDGEQITLPAIASPTLGGGTGVLQSETAGPNGTAKYFQFSN